MNLRKERDELTGHIRKVMMADDHLDFSEASCDRIREGFYQADSTTRRQIIELLFVRGIIAYENGEKVLYLKFLIDTKEQQRVLPMQTSPLQSSHFDKPIEIKARLAFYAIIGRWKMASFMFAMLVLTSCVLSSRWSLAIMGQFGLAG